ncbi:MAG: PhzF family phenazine biosynthesis protein [Proteobacteria bacterium]|nr:PhzF family phenazine biosynthesis protein [Pseudomonadota bacterium]
MRVPLYIVDAFSDRPFAGNPAAICPLEAWLPEEVMQRIGAEMNFSETAFLVPSGDGWHIRWFTPTLEVDLVGHATLAAAYVIFERIDPSREKVRFYSLSGPLIVRRAGGRLAMDFPSRRPQPCAAPEGLLAGLRAKPTQVLAAQHYLVVYESAEEIQSLAPDLDRLARLDRAAVIVTAPGPPGDFVSRFFAPANGVPEDPASGVAHCSLIPYWSERLGRPQLIGHQLSKRGGIFFCEDRGERVIIAGHAALFLEGAITL